MPAIVWSGAQGADKTNCLIANKITASNVTGSTSQSGYEAVNVTDQGTSLSWKPVSMPANLTVDLGSAQEVDGAGLAAHTLATSATTLHIEYSSDNVSWTSAGSILPVSNEEMFILFSPITARYWRVRFTGGIPSVGVLFLGKRFVFPHVPTIEYRPLNHARVYEKFFNDSLGGNFINNRVRSAGAETEVDMGFVTRNYADTALPAFEVPYNKGMCFFYASCPDKYPLDVGYCRAGGQNDTVQVDYIDGQYANLSFTLRAYVGYS